MSFSINNPVDVLAGNLIGEARGCGISGMEHVASVVMNRVNSRWQSSIISVVLAPYQFSCWDDKNRAVIESAFKTMPTLWQTAISIAQQAVAGKLVDETNGADSYYALSMKKPAYWAKPPAVHTFSDGWHSFWKVKATSINNVPEKNTSIYSVNIS